MLDCFYKYTDKNQFEKSRNKNNKFVFCKINMYIKEYRQIFRRKKNNKNKVKIDYLVFNSEPALVMLLGLGFPFLIAF